MGRETFTPELPFEEPEEFVAGQGESEDESSAGLAPIVEKALLWSTDWTIETILSQLEKGNIELNPEFQRREAWNDEKKSSFIESILLNFPIPQLVLAERKDRRGAYIIIDGKQRLLAIRRFCASTSSSEQFLPFKLTGLRIRSDLNGAKWSELLLDPAHEEDVRIFENQTIRTTIIRGWPTEDYLYTVFHRLNTGSVSLSPQELRQALHPGKFLAFADRFTLESPTMHTVLRNPGPDFRMRDVELVVRFFAFRDRIESYRGNLKQFLDDTSKILTDTWSVVNARIYADSIKLEKAIEITYRVFTPKNAFRKYVDGKYEGRFNRAVFDIMVFYFADLGITDIDGKETEIEMSFQVMCKDDPAFLRSLETTTKSVQATLLRLEFWGKALELLLHKDLNVPTLQGGQILRD